MPVKTNREIFYQDGYESISQLVAERHCAFFDYAENKKYLEITFLTLRAYESLRVVGSEGLNSNGLGVLLYDGMRLADLTRSIFISDARLIRKIRKKLDSEIVDGSAYEVDILREPTAEAISLTVDEDKPLFLLIGKKRGSLPPVEPICERCKKADASFFSRFTPRTLRVFNVGQASFNVLSNGHGSYMAFDLGLPLSFQRDALSAKEANDIHSAQDYIPSCPFKAVVLSHFDYDHISGYRYMTTNQLMKASWFVPDPTYCCSNPDKELSVTAKVLLILLVACNKAYLVSGPNSYEMVSCSGSYVRLYPGTACKKKCCTRQNQMGLVTEIESYDARALLPGDSQYCCWNKDVLDHSPFDLVLVPHHGGWKKECGFRDVRGKYVVLSYGSHNTYSHPSGVLISTIRHCSPGAEIIGAPFFKKARLLYSFSTKTIRWEK